MASKTNFSCSKSLDITQADKLHKRLLAAVEKGCDIELSADQIEKADTAGLQLLVALCNATRQKGLSVSWKQPSQTLISSAQRLGLTTSLGLPTNT